MRKSRLWTAVSAVVGLAALVVLASCQGPAGVAGAAGAMGIPGAAGPAGPPGTTDNAPPIVETALMPMYLALNGTEEPATPPTTDAMASETGYITKMVKLTTAFTDADSPGRLSYTAVPTDKTIAKVVGANATTGAVTSDTLTITGLKAGTTTITVTAFDGVNKQGAPTTFDVTVVDRNTVPAVSVTQLIDDYTGIAKLISDSAVEIPFAAVIKPGVVGETEGIMFRTVVGSGLKADADTVYVEADTKPGTVSGSYILTVTRIPTAILDDKSQMNKITIFAVDSFGAETKVDLNGGGEHGLVVGVNAPPRLARSLPTTVYLYRSAARDNDMPDVTDPSKGKVPNTVFFVEDFFKGLEMTDSTATPPVMEGDTTCSFSTKPGQPTGGIAVAAVAAAGDDAAMPEVAAAPITKTTKATVTNGEMALVASEMPTMAHHYPTSLTHTGSGRARVVVNSAPSHITVPEEVRALGLGSFDLTITCRDDEKIVSSTAKIEVFGPQL